MTPEEITTELHARNRDTLNTRHANQELTQDEVLALMDAAAMKGFRLGSNVAVSMIKGALLVQLARLGIGGRGGSSETGA
jgi:hypothetical protein